MNTLLVLGIPSEVYANIFIRTHICIEKPTALLPTEAIEI
jgi:hypothetical protein